MNNIYIYIYIYIYISYLTYICYSICVLINVLWQISKCIFIHFYS